MPTSETAARTLLLEAGWWPVHHYFRMQIALTHAPAAPDVLTRTFDAEHNTEAVRHQVQGAFSNVEGHVPRSLESWRATGFEQPDWTPNLWLLPHDARGIVGAALGERGEQETGVVRTVAVAERARGRGHGRTLLLRPLAALRREQLYSAEAAAHGPTAAAARLFESVGMTPVARSERWEKVVGA